MLEPDAIRTVSAGIDDDHRVAPAAGDLYAARTVPVRLREVTEQRAAGVDQDQSVEFVVVGVEGRNLQSSGAVIHETAAKTAASVEKGIRGPGAVVHDPGAVAFTIHVRDQHVRSIILNADQEPRYLSISP